MIKIVLFVTEKVFGIKGLFTGWVDVGLTEGQQEAKSWSIFEES